MSKIITVLGNEGKTLLSYYLAQRLATGKKRCVIVSTNSSNPDIRYVMPLIDDKNKSLGRVLSLGIIDTQSILNNMMSFNNENIGIISYAMNESKKNYPKIIDANLETFFSILKSVVEYIIVDTETSRNEIDEYALKQADVNLCVTSANIKGLAYRHQLPDDNNITHILYSNSSYNPIDKMKETFKYNIKHFMPYCKNLQYVYNGALLDDVNSCPKAYSKFLNKLIKEIINNE